MTERPSAPAALVRTLVALVVGQVCLHASMAGVRMAGPLWVLRHAHAEWTVGVLMGLFAAAQVVLALPAGRMADRYGYHRPLYLAVALTSVGGALALTAVLWPAMAFPVFCLAAVCCGAGANCGLIVILRTAGRSTSNATQRKQVFSWIGLAPAVSNAVGPFLTGLLIDHGGFAWAFGVLSLMPLAALGWARRVPREAPTPEVPNSPRPKSSWDLLRVPGMGRLLVVNWLLSASWDVHAFAVPILGNQRGLSASAIGTVLGLFALSVSGVRVLIPALAHRLHETTVLMAAMGCAAAVFSVYPLAHSAWTMACCAVLLGLPLGSVQPMIMSLLHQLTPHERHGEAIALRSMTLNTSSALMPLLFGALGAAVGAGVLFWLMAAGLLCGSVPARRIGGATSVRT